MKHVCLCLLLLPACRPADVVAEAGGRRVTRADIEERLRGRRESIDEALAALISEERLAATALARRLDEQPGVRARLKAAERAILAQALLDAEAGAPSDKALRDAYDRSTSLAARELELAHIFIALPSSPTPDGVMQAQGRANAVWARLLGGENFEEVAKTDSEDTATKDNGGVLGVVREGQVDQAVFDAAAKLEPGAFSGPVQTAFGLHVLKALTPVKTVKPPFAEARGRLERDLRDAKLAALTKTLETSLPAKTWEEALAPLRAAAKEGTR